MMRGFLRVNGRELGLSSWSFALSFRQQTSGIQPSIVRTRAEFDRATIKKPEGQREGFTVVVIVEDADK